MLDDFDPIELLLTVERGLPFAFHRAAIKASCLRGSLILPRQDSHNNFSEISSDRRDVKWRFDFFEAAHHLNVCSPNESENA